MKWHGPARLPGPELVESIICANGESQLQGHSSFREHPTGLRSPPCRFALRSCRNGSLPPFATHRLSETATNSSVWDRGIHHARRSARSFGGCEMGDRTNPTGLALSVRWKEPDGHGHGHRSLSPELSACTIPEKCSIGNIEDREIKLRNRSVRAVTCGCCNTVPVARYAPHKRNSCDGAGSVGPEQYRALGPVLVRRDNDPGIRAKVQLPEHVADRERGHQQILRIVPWCIALKHGSAEPRMTGFPSPQCCRLDHNRSNFPFRRRDYTSM